MLVWNEYSCNVSGGTYKFVECEECQQKYVYRMERHADGQGNSLYFLDNAGAQRRAENQAQAVLQHLLKTECDAVPCPKCGWYQEDMVKKLCREHRLWMYWLGIFAMFAGVLCGSLGYPMYEAEYRLTAIILFLLALVGIGGGVGAILGRRSLASGFEPNAAPVEDRLQNAAEKAQTLKAFKKWLKEQGIDMPEAMK